MVLRRVFHHEIRHYDVFRYKIHVIAQHMSIQKNYNFDFMSICLSSVANTFIVFTFIIHLFLTIYGHVVGNLNFLNHL